MTSALVTARDLAVCIDRLPKHKIPVVIILGHKIGRHVQDRHKKTIPYSSLSP